MPPDKPLTERGPGASREGCVEDGGASEGTVG